MQRNEGKPERGLAGTHLGEQALSCSGRKGAGEARPAPPAALWHESCSFGSGKVFRKSHGDDKP